MVTVTPLALEGVAEILPRRFADARGFFSETYVQSRLADIGMTVEFVQDNHSLSHRKGTVRGLHYQLPPFAQDKLVRVTRGAIFDVAVDIRRGSPQLGRWIGVTLSAEKWNQLLVPRGYAHGFMTLEDDTEVVYKVSADYAPQYERCVRFDDPALAIDWPLKPEHALLSDKDRAAPLLAEAELHD